MITSVNIRNFKSHKDTRIDLGNLTLLCGQNGVGKSAFLQSLLLLRQTHQKNRLHDGLDLNKPLCYIGTAEDALYQSAEDEIISFEIGTGDGETHYFSFEASDYDSSFLKKIRGGFRTTDNRTTAFNAAQPAPSIFTNSFQYISAARLPEYTYDDYAVESENQLSLEEGKGELTAQFLHFFSKKKVIDSLLHPKVSFSDLLSQTIAWEREISEGVNIIPQKVGLSYDVRYSFGNGPTKDFSTKNVGFGLSYALPVIVAILSAEPGSLIVVENPEAHLHPYGQAKLVELMCLAAAGGVQIIAETHSDHIINGTLVSVRHEKIKSSQAKIYYFERDEKEHATHATPVYIEENGKIKHAPPGFFDQIGKDLRELMKTKTNGRI